MFNLANFMMNFFLSPRARLMEGQGKIESGVVAQQLGPIIEGINEQERKNERVRKETSMMFQQETSASVMFGLGWANGVIKIMDQDGGWHEVAVHCLLEAFEGRVGKDDHWKMVLLIEEVKNKGV